MARVKIICCAALCLLVVVLSGVSSNPASSLGRLKRAPRVRRVIGGSDAEEGQWPYLTHLTGKVRSGWWGHTYYYCGGSLINRRWVLTAAHCFNVQNAPSGIKTPKYWHIKAGEVEREHDIVDNAKSFMGWLFQRNDWQLWYVHADKIITHPEYDDSDGALWKNDIALVKLEKDLPLEDDPNIGAVALPVQDNLSWPSAGTPCIMKGWGCSANGGPVEDIAQHVELPALSSDTCSTFFGAIGNTRMCAGENMGDTGICSGDSGGPLVCADNGSWVQAGLASFTSATSPGQVPGVFTRIASYMSWIQETIDNN